MRSELEAAKTEVMRLEVENGGLRTDNSEAQKEATRLGKEADELQQEVMRLKASVEGGDRDREGALADAVKERDALSIELADTVKERDALSVELADAVKQREECEAEIAHQLEVAGEAQKGRAIAEERVSILETEMEEVMRLKAFAEGGDKDREGALADAVKKRDALSVELADAVKQKDALSVELADAVKKREELDAEKEREVMRLRAEKEEEVMRLRSALEVLERQYGEAEAGGEGGEREGRKGRGVGKRSEAVHDRMKAAVQEALGGAGGERGGGGGGEGLSADEEIRIKGMLAVLQANGWDRP